MIKRSVENKLKGHLKRKEITILVGARQVGKTTIIKKVFHELEQQGENVLFFNMDFEDDARFFDSQQNLLRKIQLEFGNKSGYVFIDEIQQKQDAGRFLKGLYDSDLPYKFVVTGSGSLELKEKISETLTGRKYLLEMHSVSFYEFIDYKTKYKYTDRLKQFCEIEHEKLNALLNEYMTFGGYPKIVSENDVQQKAEVMNEIFTSYITKDITYLLGVRVPDRFTRLIQLLAVGCGGLINYARLATDVGISVDTLKKFLWYAEQTFVISIITPFFTNQKKELTKSPVVYFNDMGMCSFGLGRYGVRVPINKNDGFLFQNFVFQLLKNKFEKGLIRVKYWRTKDKAEVDFVVHNNMEVIPVEVKYSSLRQPTLSRSYRSFLEKYKPKTGYVINMFLDSRIDIGDTKVKFIPYWKLMFE